MIYVILLMGFDFWIDGYRQVCIYISLYSLQVALQVSLQVEQDKGHVESDL